MKKLVFLCLFLPCLVQAKVTFKWIGVSGFILEDGKNTIVFDPAMTTVGFLDFMPWGKVKSNPEIVKAFFNKCSVSKVDAVFINHSHTDHMIDLITVLQNYGGVVYGSESTLNYARGGDIVEEKLQRIKFGDEIQIGDFKIKVLPSKHGEHFLGYTFADGKIDKPFKTPAHPSHFKVGTTHNFYIEHPEIKIVFNAVARMTDENPKINYQADILLATIAKRGDSKTHFKNRIEPADPRLIIPLHYDNFFSALNLEGKPERLPLVDPDEFGKNVENMTQGKVKVAWPNYCETVDLTN